MRLAPALDAAAPAGPIQPQLALLINPFYRKDPHASFGKHVLTPTLALTSLAGATPAGWRVRYWDENLLQGPPPLDPVPEVVGIAVRNGVPLWPRILADVAAGRLAPRYEAEYGDYARDPPPDRSILPRWGFL